MSDETRKLLAELLNRNDTYGNVGQALAAFQYRPQKAGDETTALGVGLGQALASGILGGLSRRRKAAQQREVAAILPELTRDPFSVQRPEGLDADVYEALRQDAVLKQIAEQEDAERQRRQLLVDLEKIRFGKEYDLRGALGQALLADPRTINEAKKSNPNFINDLLFGGSGEPANRTSGEDALIEALKPNAGKTPIEQLVAEQAGADPSADIVDKMKATYDEVLMASGDRGLATEAAKTVVDAPKQSSAVDLKKAQEIRNTALTLATTLSGLDKTLEDLPLQGVPGQGALKVGARLLNTITDGSSESTRNYLKDRANIDSLRSRVTSIFRTAGEGVITDADREAFLEGLPSSDASLEENLARYERLMNWLNSQKQFADQLELNSTGKITPFPALEVKRSAPAPSNPEGFLSMSREQALAEARKKGLIR